ncbi:MAG: hypothetical protein WD468_00760 [Pirellulales bacterium]
MPRILLFLPLAAIFLICVASRCEAADSAAVAAHRARLTITEPPRDAQQVLTVFKQLAAEKNRPGGSAAREVVVFGQIGGMPNVWPDTHPKFPWYPGQASFFLVDSKIAKQFAQHAKHHGGHDNCVFCQQLAAKNVNAIAVVNLVDADGKTVPIDLQQVVPLKENQTVIIRGKAKLLAGSLLQIDADGIYVKPPATSRVARP